MTENLVLTETLLLDEQPTLSKKSSVSKKSIETEMNSWSVLWASVLLKLALIPAYKSTDFEVHRNWMAITHSLPRHQWYYEDTSIWTLDYPPFFAWFEYGLSLIARWVDPNMLVVSNLNYTSTETVYFMRLSVIVVDCVFFFAILNWLQHQQPRLAKEVPHWMHVSFLFLCAGLLIVDNIHFQYNGFLYGIQVASIVCFAQNRFLVGGILFAILLQFKHIFLYQAPAYFVFILSAYCANHHARFLKMALCVVFVFASAWMPFIGHLHQILQRLFPFKRGLCHAYWAPNVWALYSFLDKIILYGLKKIGFSVAASTSLTRGIVGDTQFSILPNVLPSMTFSLTLLTQLPALWILYKRPSLSNFIHCLTLTAFCSFLFGWHVHEKAILMMVIPISLMATSSVPIARLFFILNATSIVSLFPLLFTPKELIIKFSLLVLSMSLQFYYFRNVFKSAVRKFILSAYEVGYLLVLVATAIFSEMMYPLLIFLLKNHQNRRTFGQKSWIETWVSENSEFLIEKTQFLPLMAISVVCSVGVLYVWMGIYTIYILEFYKKQKVD